MQFPFKSPHFGVRARKNKQEDDINVGELIWSYGMDLRFQPASPKISYLIILLQCNQLALTSLMHAIIVYNLLHVLAITCELYKLMMVHQPPDLTICSWGW
jgi:hypothetical protein